MCFGDDETVHIALLRLVDTMVNLKLRLEVRLLPRRLSLSTRYRMRVRYLSMHDVLTSESS
jgi:hypothetical protein